MLLKERIAEHCSGLPHGGAPGEAQRRQGADVGERLHLVVAQANADGHVSN
jgi:hypothetical protein